MLLANASIVSFLSRCFPLSLAQLPHPIYSLVLLLFGEKQSKSYCTSRQVSSGSINWKFVFKKMTLHTMEEED